MDTTTTLFGSTMNAFNALLFLIPITLFIILVIGCVVFSRKSRYYALRGKIWRWSDKDNAFHHKGERITFNDLTPEEVASVRKQGDNK